MSEPTTMFRPPAQPDQPEPRGPLGAIFAPRAVAVIGASEKAGSVGRSILWNLIGSPFGGTVYPVNPKRPNVLGIRSYPSIAAVPEPVDLAVVVTPAPTVPQVIGECADAGVKGAIIISAGFKEVGPEGAELERRVMEQARRGRMRLIGPNCLGVMNPVLGLNATFAAGMARRGTVGFLSQSGALCTAILDWSLRVNVGFSAFVSIGSMLDVGWGDLIDYLADDPETKCIVIYMESIGDARAFLSAAREVALSKPIIVIKAGRTEAAAKAAASHTGSMAGSDEVLDAAFRRVGVLRVSSISQVFDMADVLAKQPRPRGPHLAIVTNAGGPGVLATDALIEGGGELAKPTEATLKTLDAFLPSAWSHANPIDILGDADATRYARTLEVAAADPSIDGMLVILTPQAMSDPTATAEQLAKYAHIPGKPVLASWMGGDSVRPGEEILDRAGIPTFAYPDTAARMFTLMWRSHYNLQALYETPDLPAGDADAAGAREGAGSIIAAARAEGRTVLTEFESKQILAAYGIPTVETRVAAAEDEAVAAAGVDRLSGRPQAALAHDHAQDRRRRRAAQPGRCRGGPPRVPVDRGVGARPRRPGALRRRQRAADGEARRLRADRRQQPRPAVRPGPPLRHRRPARRGLPGPRLALPPLNTTLARRMMEQTRILAALKGVRGRRPVDLPALERLLVRFSDLVVEQRWIKEIDINPLLASPDRLLALDARVIVHGPEVRESELPAAGDPALPDPPGRDLDGERRHDAAPPADPPRGRAAAGRVPRDALGADRRAPLLPRDEAEHAGRARAADPHLLHRLRPRDGPGGRAGRRRGRRRPRDPGRRPAEQAPRHRRRGVRPPDHPTGSSGVGWARS